VALTVGQTTEVTLTDATGGTIVIHAVDDQAQPIGDLCFDLYADASGARGAKIALPPCQHGDATTDGETTLIGVPPGDFLLAQTTRLTGYIPSDDVPVSVAG